MKRRLFWKILIGFWITSLIITQGVWLMFALLRPPPEQSDYARGMAREAIAAATSAIRDSGEVAFRQQLASWPRDQRSRIEVRPVSDHEGSRTALARGQARAPDGRVYRISYYAEPTEHFHGIFSTPREVVIVEIVGGLCFSAILAWYLTNPIARMRAGFSRLADGDFATRLGPAMGRRRDEIADLAHDFDSMAERLEELVSARDRLLADVSHELRTPLARLTLAIGLARQDPAKITASLDRIDREAAKLDDMVQELLTLAKLESDPNRGQDYFNFAELVRVVIQDARYEAAAKRIEVTLVTEPADPSLEWTAQGNGALVSRAVENIVRNALRYSPEGGQVTAILRRESATYRLSVRDQGPGVPADALDALFQPFGVSADGFGFGLGLNIAQRAIAVHGGTISARNQPRGGLEMQVAIPIVHIEAG